MNGGPHCHSKFSVHAPQPVLDSLKCLYSINNMFILFTHLLLANANVYPGPEWISVCLVFQVLFIHLFNQPEAQHQLTLTGALLKDALTLMLRRM